MAIDMEQRSDYSQTLVTEIQPAVLRSMFRHHSLSRIADFDQELVGGLKTIQPPRYWAS